MKIRFAAFGAPLLCSAALALLAGSVLPTIAVGGDANPEVAPNPAYASVVIGDELLAPGLVVSVRQLRDGSLERLDPGAVRQASRREMERLHELVRANEAVVMIAVDHLRAATHAMQSEAWSVEGAELRVRASEDLERRYEAMREDPPALVVLGSGSVSRNVVPIGGRDHLPLDDLMAALGVRDASAWEWGMAEGMREDGALIRLRGTEGRILGYYKACCGG